MVTLAEVEIAVKANLTQLTASSKEVEKKVNDLEKKLKSSLQKIASLNDQLNAQAATSDERANKRKIASAEKAAAAKQAAIEKTAAAEQKAAEKAAAASERANQRAIAAAEKAAAAKQALFERATAAEQKEVDKTAAAAERANQRATLAAQKASATQQKAQENTTAATLRELDKAVYAAERANQRATLAANKNEQAKIKAASRASLKEQEEAAKSAAAEERAKQRAIDAANKAQNAKIRAATAAAAAEKKSSSAAFASIGTSLAGLAKVAGTVFVLKQIQEYADSWTVAGNKINAASVIAERSARSLEDINQIATKTRSGFTETIDLYSKLLRATKDVAKSENEVAQATEIVNKAFKAGGAAVSEQKAGILQLSQALGSGMLQGDELRSIRENAPLLAQAIANEFGTTIGGLKELGAQGALSVDRVFKAILNAAPDIDRAFNATTSTIGEGFTLVENSVTQLIGEFGQFTGISDDVIKGFKEIATQIDGITEAIHRLKNGDISGAVDSVLNPDQTINKMLEGMEKSVIAYKEIKALNAAFEEFQYTLDNTEPDKGQAFKRLQEELNAGAVSAQQAKARIRELFGDDIAYHRITEMFDPLLEALSKVESLAKAAKAGLDLFGSDPRSAGFEFLHEKETTNKFIQQQIEDSKRSDKDIAIDKEADKLKEAAKTAGVALEDAAAKIIAATMVANREIASSNSAVGKKAFEVIADYEKYREKAYWDVNHYRAGFGSDTTTHADGTKETITKDSIVSFADATRDLARRIGEFQESIKKSIGADTFASFNEDQQAALTSIAYNYGSLPQRIVDAIKTGNQTTIVEAIRNLSNDNGGINKTRRNSEADLFLSGAPSGVQSEVKNADRFKEFLADSTLQTDALKRQAETLGVLNPLMNDYGYAVAKAQKAEELLNKAKDDEQKITPELIADIDQRAEAYARETAAVNMAKEANEKLKSTMQDVAETGKSVMQGFISDLEEGKSGAEALSNALKKVADKLLDVGLDMLFGTGAQAGQPSIFGTILGALGFASGTPNTGGTKGQARGIVHGQEAVIPLPNGGKVPVEVNVPNSRMNPSIGGGSQKVDMSIELITDESMIAGVARTEIKNAAPDIVQISVKESQKQTLKNMPGYISNAQQRSL